jgi:hypothetical protein
MSSDAHAEMVVPVSAAEASKVQVGDPAEVRIDGVSEGPFSAQVVSVTSGSGASEANKYFVTAQLTNVPQQLSYGQAGRLTITVASTSHALVVPQSAIVIKDGVPHVLRLTDGHDELMPVTTGITVDGETEVISGLSSGDRIRSAVNIY